MTILLVYVHMCQTEAQVTSSQLKTLKWAFLTPASSHFSRTLVLLAHAIHCPALDGRVDGVTPILKIAQEVTSTIPVDCLLRVGTPRVDGTLRLDGHGGAIYSFG